jgi:steroid delta-isomerase-like uncharacterized protein
MFEENRATVRRFFEECWNQGNLQHIEDMVTRDYRHQDPVFPAMGSGTESLRRQIQMCRNAFPDIHVSIGNEIAERDEVVIQWLASGTHEGLFLGLEGTGKQVKVSGTSIFRLKDGKIADQWAEWNLVSLLHQIGFAMPSMKMSAS